jgi:hypothetical protein
MLEQQIRELVRRYLAREIDPSAFAEYFAPLYFLVRRNPKTDTAACQLCNAIVLPLAEFSRGHRSESSLREELENAVRHFGEGGRTALLTAKYAGARLAREMTVDVASTRKRPERAHWSGCPYSDGQLTCG